MFSPLSLAVALTLPAAPIPKTPEPAVGPPPVIMNLRPDADGKVRVTVRRTVTRTIKRVVPNPNGGPAQQVDHEYKSARSERVELTDVKDLTAHTADGKTIDTRDALDRLAGGAIVVLSGGGDRVSPQYLKLFRDDVLVLVSPEFVGLPGQATGIPMRVDGVNPVIIRGGGANAMPIRIQVQNGNIVPVPPPVPVPPAPAPAPEPEPAPATR